MKKLTLKSEDFELLVYLLLTLKDTTLREYIYKSCSHLLKAIQDNVKEEPEKSGG